MDSMVNVKVSLNGTQLLDDRTVAAITVTAEKDGSSRVLLAGEVSPGTAISMLAVGVRDVLDGIAEQFGIPYHTLFLDFQHALLLARTLKGKKTGFSVSIDKH